MSTPSEYDPSSSQIFHQAAASFGLSTVHSKSNFTSEITNVNFSNNCQNGNNFCSDLSAYDATSSPMIQYPPDFINLTQSMSNKTGQVEKFPRPESQTLNKTITSTYWSEEPPFTPFGVLPHEMCTEVNNSYDGRSRYIEEGSRIQPVFDMKLNSLVNYAEDLGYQDMQHIASVDHSNNDAQKAINPTMTQTASFVISKPITSSFTQSKFAPSVQLESNVYHQMTTDGTSINNHLADMKVTSSPFHKLPYSPCASTPNLSCNAPFDANYFDQPVNERENLVKEDAQPASQLNEELSDVEAMIKAHSALIEYSKNLKEPSEKALWLETQSLENITQLFEETTFPDSVAQYSSTNDDQLASNQLLNLEKSSVSNDVAVENSKYPSVLKGDQLNSEDQLSASYGQQPQTSVSNYCKRGEATTKPCSPVKAVKAVTKVIMPKIEDEFDFLFNQQMSHYKEIASLDKDLATSRVSKKVDFQASYIEFLQNCKYIVKLKTEKKNSNYMQKEDSSYTRSNICQSSVKLERVVKIRRSSSGDDKPPPKRIKLQKSLKGKKDKNEFKANVKTEESNEQSTNEFQMKHKNDRVKKISLADEPAKKRKRKSKSSTKDVVPRRKVSERKAKQNVLEKIKKAMDSAEVEESSSDSDSSWTPNGEDAVRKSNRVRNTHSESNKNKDNNEDELNGKKDTDINEGSVKHVIASNESRKFRVGAFYCLKNCMNSTLVLFRKMKNNKFQKFVKFEGSENFCASAEFIRSSVIDHRKYEEVKVKVIEKNKGHFLVHLCNTKDTLADLALKENFFNDSAQYETPFTVYIQTLISQALDSNFLTEIVKENDVYFLTNVKAIDDLAVTYTFQLSTLIKWERGSSADLLVKTWPFVSLSSARNITSDCIGCEQTGAKQMVIFYGQPYIRDSLQGCQVNSNIPNNLEKTVYLCYGCAKLIKLYNKIWHQKYHVFVECAKYVSKKRSENRNGDISDILKDLLGDKTWLSKLFNETRNIWFQIWITVKQWNDD